MSPSPTTSNYHLTLSKMSSAVVISPLHKNRDDIYRYHSIGRRGKRFIYSLRKPECYNIWGLVVVIDKRGLCEIDEIYPGGWIGRLNQSLQKQIQVGDRIVRINGRRTPTEVDNLQRLMSNSEITLEIKPLSRSVLPVRH